VVDIFVEEVFVVVEIFVVVEVFVVVATAVDVVVAKSSGLSIMLSYIARRFLTSNGTSKA